jgi:DNA-binding transcriptional regulator GbsR (MarR family)
MGSLVKPMGKSEGAAGAVMPALSPLEVEVIDFFVGALRLLGLPRTLGEIYGLLFIRPRPLALDELVAELRMSKGSASQGLRLLRQIGAAKTVYVAGDRRDHFSAEIDLKKLVAGFVTGKMLPHLQGATARLERLRALEAVEAKRATREEGEFLRRRLHKLEHWERRARNLAPLIGKLLDGP